MRTLSMRFFVLSLASAFCAYAALAQQSCPSTDDARPHAGPRSDYGQPAPGFLPFHYNSKYGCPSSPRHSQAKVAILLYYASEELREAPLNLSRIEVLDAEAAAARPIAIFEQEQLETMLQSVGGGTVAGPKGNLTIAGGRTAIVFMSIAFDRGSHIPKRLLHHVMTTDSMAEGAAISTLTLRCMCSARRWKEQTGLQTMVRVMTRTTIIGAEFSFSMAGR